MNNVYSHLDYDAKVRRISSCCIIMTHFLTQFVHDLT
jgi:hypothetical protein